MRKRSRIIMVLSALTLLGACAPARVLSGNPTSVVVKREGSIQEATDLAVKHCAQYGKGVRLIHSERFVMSFDCV